MKDKFTELYTTNEYITKNPTIHEEDSPWKIEKLTPLIDKFIETNTKKTINLLDVGGGAGIILSALSSYIAQNCQVKVNKYILDLSPKMLQIQADRNPDIIKALQEDISKTSLPNKFIDLTLLIDVLEHVPYPAEALKEL
jgi:ubiquinone/menaquinone biosynthesis C-methylase UbiE